MSYQAKVVMSVAFGVALGTVAVGAGYRYSQGLESRRQAIALTNGNPDRAPEPMLRYGCVACHEVSGIRAPGGMAAQSLSEIGKRQYIGGAAPNTPENLVRWIVNPKELNSRTAMPVTGVTESQGRDIAAYLLALR
jgi:cytochrome c1